MKKYLSILLFSPLLVIAKTEAEPFVLNTPLHPWYANGGKDLIVNFSKINFDTRLVKEVRKHKEVKTPYINVSGKLDNIVTARKQTNENTTRLSTKILTSKLHFTSVVHPNVIGHFAFSFKFNNVNKTIVDLDRAFITFDTKKYTPIIPTYVTIGQLFLPFGTHSTGQLSEPITGKLGKVRGKFIKAGYEINSNFFGSAAITEKGIVVFDAKYNYKGHKSAANLGISYTNKQTHKFVTATTNVGRTVMPFISVEYNKIGIRTELITAVTKDKIRKPLLATRAEGFYSFMLNGKFCSYSIGYETKLNKSLDRSLPRYRVNTTFNMVILPFIFTSLELVYENSHFSKKTIGAGFRIGAAF